METLLWPVVVAEPSVGMVMLPGGQPSSPTVPASYAQFCNGAKAVAMGWCLQRDGGTDGDLHVMAAVRTLLDGSFLTTA